MFESKIANMRKCFMKFCRIVEFGAVKGAKVCKSCRSRQELSNEYLILFTCKNRLRYSRDRVCPNLEVIQQIFSIDSKNAMPLGPGRSSCGTCFEGRFEDPPPASLEPSETHSFKSHVALFFEVYRMYVLLHLRTPPNST